MRLRQYFSYPFQLSWKGFAQTTKTRTTTPNQRESRIFRFSMRSSLSIHHTTVLSRFQFGAVHQPNQGTHCQIPIYFAFRRAKKLSRETFPVLFWRGTVTPDRYLSFLSKHTTLVNFPIKSIFSKICQDQLYLKPKLSIETATSCPRDPEPTVKETAIILPVEPTPAVEAPTIVSCENSVTTSL